MRHISIRSRWVVQAVSRFLAGCAVGLLFAASPVWAVEPPAEPMDCRVHDTTKSGITLGFKVGNFFLQAGPEVTYSRERGIAWDRVVQGFIARYKELCSRYNAGLVTKEEYEQRLKEMEGLHREAMELERKMVEETRNRAKSAVDELDRTLAQRKAAEAPAPDPVKDSLDDLNRRIDKLEPIGRPLLPKLPCLPPDMLGAPGRAC
ncbi:MAG: hypothetical protein D4R81_00620 [Nitrospiraceae bacterium]|nr:MAG: hypothetical protein D4R81_00620 [Nitrospiraceae bacterium]